MKSKRLFMTIVILLFWLALGGFGMWLGGESFTFYELSAYFAAMLIPVSTYVYGESRRGSSKTMMVSSGESSKREIVTYLFMLVWGVVGAFGIIMDISMAALAAYIATLTPFISSYILGETYRPSQNKRVISSKTIV